LPIDVKRYAALAGMAAAALVFGIAAHGITRGWQESRQENAIKANEAEIFHSPSSFVAGNPRGDVSVVAFFDHNCPYCRRDAPALVKLTEDDGQVRLVLKELPVLGAESEAVAKVALAAARQGKYFEFYQRLFASPGPANEVKALRIAGELGLDQERLRQDMQDPAIAATLAENERLAQTLKVRGVPFYIVGDKILRDGTGDFYADLTKLIADARAAGKQADSSR
jgi:protein-disulfide isomerase